MLSRSRPMHAQPNSLYVARRSAPPGQSYSRLPESPRWRGDSGHCCGLGLLRLPALLSPDFGIAETISRRSGRSHAGLRFGTHNMDA